MELRKGMYVQGYNAQAVVKEDQILLCAVVVQDANDRHSLEPMLERLLRDLSTELEGEVKRLSGDAGY